MPPTPVRLARLNHDLTQFDLCKRARLLPSRLSMIERGMATPRPEEATRIARALQEDVAKLFPADGGQSGESVTVTPDPDADAARAQNAE